MVLLHPIIFLKEEEFGVESDRNDLTLRRASAGGTASYWLDSNHTHVSFVRAGEVLHKHLFVSRPLKLLTRNTGIRHGDDTNVVAWQHTGPKPYGMVFDSACTEEG